MVKKEKHLHQGLDAIFGDDLAKTIDDIQKGEFEYGSGKQLLEISTIRTNPYQPRKEFDAEKLKELCESIKEHGVFQPILVRESFGGYELVAGERRLRASKLAGLDVIPAIIAEFNDEQMMEISLLENIQRENLNVVEEAFAYQRLIDNLNYTQQELAQRIGKSRVYITNILRLLKLPSQILDLLRDGKLTSGHARCLITVEDEEKQEILAEEIVRRRLSVREAEKLVKKNETVTKKVKEKDPFYVSVEKNIQSKLQTKVDIGKSSINIKYSDVNDLNRILEILDCLDD